MNPLKEVQMKKVKEYNKKGNYTWGTFLGWTSDTFQLNYK